MMRSLAAAALLISVLLPSAHAQNGQIQQADATAHRRELQFEISGGVGYTSVDLQKWGGNGSTNEELLLSQFDARLLFALAPGFPPAKWVFPYISAPTSYSTISSSSARG